MILERRKPMQLKAKMPYLDNLKRLTDKLRPCFRVTFEGKYQKILDLLSIRVKTFVNTAITHCISNNLVLALRQSGFVMLGNPEEKALEEMVLHDMGDGNPSLLHKNIHSWNKVHTKGTELGKKLHSKRAIPRQ
ncbi:hypothetical protein KIW84_032267 [Lathyrus oleraceus]|uniref:DUF7745 domain-containing protein n=1 Tax=Pisum sativum TaxID=3888 RepID=A0A9D4XX26_PEA|nr:hypothetical protein KIW84_032267 [Pisum sativum]